MPTYTDLLSRLRNATITLGESEKADVHRVLELVDAHVTESGFSVDPSTVPVRIELRGLAERLGRRGAEGIPAASLARALSADLAGYAKDAEEIRGQCDQQLMHLGH